MIMNSEEKKNEIGKLKIFLGMVAGVGKTYTMLSTAHQLKKSGIDVIIGYLESHGRKETEFLATGLPIIARRQIEYKGKEFPEMDLNAIILRHPQIVLIDELAHTNVTGAKHDKRYKDVQEILGHGIDVYTTLNIQHVESASNVVTEITNTPIYETVPDIIIDEADEIELIDLDPDQVLDRLREGKIYPPEKIATSLEHFFSRSNLTALREIVLRTLADKVNSDLRDFHVLRGVPQIWKTNHRLLVLIDHNPGSDKLIRKARRLASGLNVQWIAGRVEKGEGQEQLTEEELHQRNVCTNLAKQLGAEVAVIHDMDETSGLVRLARTYQDTLIMLERPAKNFRGIYSELRMTRRLAYDLPEVDLIFVSDMISSRKNVKRFDSHIKTFLAEWSLKKFLLSLVGPALVTLMTLKVFPVHNYLLVGMMYLIILNFNALVFPGIIIVLTTLLTGCAWNFFYIHPRFTWHISASTDWGMLLVFLFAAITSGLLTYRPRKKERNLHLNDERMSLLYFLTRNIFQTHGIHNMSKLLIEKIFELFGAKAGIFFPKKSGEKALDSFVMGNIYTDEKELNVANWAFFNQRPAGKFTDTLSSVSGTYIPLLSGKNCYGVLGLMLLKEGGASLSHYQLLMLEDMACHFAIGLEREALSEDLRKAQVTSATNEIYQTLQKSLLQELKGPISHINEMAVVLDASGVLEAKEITKETKSIENSVLNLIKNRGGDIHES